MGKLLHIIASPREESRTLEISNPFLESFKAKHKDRIIDELNLTKEKLPELGMERVDGNMGLIEGKNLFGELKESWEDIIMHINRFLSADLYLITVPMWNFHIPYTLKHYIDVIVQPTYLFRYTQSIVEGLVKGKKMIVASTRGGQYVTPPTQRLDFQEPYLLTIFGFLGITDITFLKAEPMDQGEELRKQKREEAGLSAKRPGREI